MTESEWLACPDWFEMLRFRHDRISDRKIRLATIGICRDVWHLMDERSRKAVEFAERFADEGKESQPKEANTVTDAAHKAFWETFAQGSREAQRACWLACYANGVVPSEPSGFMGKGNEARFLREVAGNPFRPVMLDETWLRWNNHTVVQLAQATDDERLLPSGALANGRLAILADALEETGCTDLQILKHCREPGPHVRGCFVVDLLLGKK